VRRLDNLMELGIRRLRGNAIVMVECVGQDDCMKFLHDLFRNGVIEIVDMFLRTRI
jgi:hypothetical protein